MAKFFGAIGYAETVEVRPGIWEEQIVERVYYGDLKRESRRLQPTGQVIDNLNIANEISIVADPFAYEHFHTMRYVTLHGAKWKVTNVEVNSPRLILSVGGVYNEPTA